MWNHLLPYKANLEFLLLSFKWRSKYLDVQMQTSLVAGTWVQRFNGISDILMDAVELSGINNQKIVLQKSDQNFARWWVSCHKGHSDLDLVKCLLHLCMAWLVYSMHTQFFHCISVHITIINKWWNLLLKWRNKRLQMLEFKQKVEMARCSDVIRAELGNSANHVLPLNHDLSIFPSPPPVFFTYFGTLTNWVWCRVLTWNIDHSLAFTGVV